MLSFHVTSKTLLTGILFLECLLSVYYVPGTVLIMSQNGTNSRIVQSNPGYYFDKFNSPIHIFKEVV